MKKMILLFCLSCLPVTLIAGEQVRIRGNFPGGEGEEIRLMEYEDLLSYRESEIASAVIDKKGNFAFEVQVDSTKLLFFRVRFARNFFYAEPHMNYHVEFSPFNFNEQQEGVDYHPSRLTLRMTLEADGNEREDINFLIDSLEQLVGDFVRTRVAGNVRANHQASMRQLKQETDSLFRETDHAYFNEHTDYYLAQLGRTLNTRSFHSLVETYFSGRPVLYNHPGYMDFFSQLFSTYIFAGSREIRFRDLEAAVNLHGSYSALMDSLGKDSLFADTRFRELVMLDGLKKMLNMEEFRESGVTGILEEVYESSKYPEHRKIAENILYMHRRFRAGQPAPSLTLKGRDGVVSFPDDFGGRYVYLFFWAGWCNLSMAELGPVLEMAGEMKEKIHFVGVLTDHDPDGVAHLLEIEDPGISFLHFDGNYRVPELYGVRNVPFYILLDPEGNFVKHNFLSPSEGSGTRLPDITGS